MSFFAYCLALAGLILIPISKSIYGETNLPPLLESVRWTINWLYAAWAVAFIYLIRKAQSFRWTPGKIRMLVLIGLIFCAVAPIFSGDLMEYLIRGRILAIYGQSPYVALPIDFPQDMLFPYSTWRINPDSYGPVWVWFQGLAVWLFPNSMIGMVWALKAILMVFAIVASIYFYKLIALADSQSPMQAGLLFVLNPLIWVSAILDGHNDIAMVSLTIVSVYYLFKGRAGLGFFLWTLAFLIKYTVLLILPFLAVLAYKKRIEQKGPRGMAGFIFTQVAIVTTTTVVLFAPLWNGTTTFLALIRASAWFYTNTLPYAVWRIAAFTGLELPQAVVKYGFLAAFGVIYVALFYRACSQKNLQPKAFFRTLAIVYLSFYWTVTIPFGFHYLLWALPWLILADWPLATLAVTLYSFTGIYSYFKRINYLILISGGIYAAAWCLFARRRVVTA